MTDAKQRGDQLLSVFFLMEKLSDAPPDEQVAILRGVFESPIWQWPGGSVNDAMAYLTEHGFIEIGAFGA